MVDLGTVSLLRAEKSRVVSRLADSFGRSVYSGLRMLAGLGGEQRWKSAENARALGTGMLALTTGGQGNPAPSAGRAGGVLAALVSSLEGR